MQYASRLPHPSRGALPLAAAALLGAGVATATFAIVNIDDQATVSLQNPVVQSAPPPSNAVAGQRNDGGPAEGAAQQAMTQPVALKGSKAVVIAPRYDGGPSEGSSASAMAQPADESATPYSGARP